MKLGYGEYVPPGDQGFARNVFLDAIRRLFPDVFDELLHEVFPMWQSLPHDLHLALEHHSPLPRRPEYDHAIKCQEALRKWAIKHNIDEPWVHEKAATLMFDWRAPTLRGEFPWHGGPFMNIPITEDIQPPTWSPWRETEEEFNERVNEYKRAVRERYEAARWEKRQEKRRHHFEWLVKFQVGGESLADIALGHENTVSQANHSTADLIGLTLRDPLPGQRGMARLPSKTVGVPPRKRLQGNRPKKARKMGFN